MSSDEYENVPAALLQEAKEVSLNLLPPKSRQVYEIAYGRFMDWCKEKKVDTYSENVLMVYFSNLSAKLKSSTLWSHYSMLRSTLDIKNGVNISKYAKLRALLKRKSDGYMPKKSMVFTKEQVDTFLNTAPDSIYLMMKVVLILGIAGACRSDELVNLKIDDLEDVNSVLIIKILHTKTKKPRSFTVLGEEYLCLVRKYIALRPSNFERRLFVKYINGKCHRVVVGIHKISAVPQEIAKFLKLSNWQEYTGHSLRRTSATLLVDAGGDLTCLKRHGGWKSSSVAEGYIEDSCLNKENIAKKILQVDKPNIIISSNNVTSNNQIHNIDVLSSSNNDVTDTSSGFVSIRGCSNCSFHINVNK